MDAITILENRVLSYDQKNWFTFLLVQKQIVERYFNWLLVEIDYGKRVLKGKGLLKLNGKSYSVSLSYSPFFPYRYDRILIDDESIKYNDKIHLYLDMSLCLYHPVVDQSPFNKIPLYQIIPWITEWIEFYLQWKKYKVWLGREIKH
jgi:hypothetical protein